MLVNKRKEKWRKLDHSLAVKQIWRGMRGRWCREAKFIILLQLLVSAPPSLSHRLVGLLLVAGVVPGALLWVEQHQVHLGAEEEGQGHSGRHRDAHHQAGDLDLSGKIYSFTTDERRVPWRKTKLTKLWISVTPLKSWVKSLSKDSLRLVSYRVVVVSPEEYWDEGQPDNAGGVHCEPNIPG